MKDFFGIILLMSIGATMGGILMFAIIGGQQLANCVQ